MGEKKSFFDSSMCKSKKNCEKCRLSRDYREGILKVFDAPEVDFDCPLGKVAEEYKNISIPSVFGMAKNLLDTAKEVAKYKKKTGRTLVSSEIQKERMDICNACNYYVNNKCKKCGCQLKVKTQFAGAKCPLNKWIQDK
jgi:hypothetical protein